ncbi:MAG: tRNA pseudouridine(38-40) synthase TruA [Anaerocolumna sp.]
MKNLIETSNNNGNSKRNIKLILEYDGSGYAGWQRLGLAAGKRSIQSLVEECLSGYLQEDIKIIGSGRTDAGVHALGQVANFHCISGRSAEDIKKNLNILLPEDIKVRYSQEMDKEFHSRYSAKAKTYEYRIDCGEVQSVFTRKYTYHMPDFLDLDAMEKASGYFLGTHDFKAFSTDRKDGKSTVRTIDHIRIYKPEAIKHQQPSHELRIAITGDGFLYNMVRIMTGTLIEIGQGLKTPGDVLKIMEGKKRQQAGTTIGSQGLFLLEVGY